MTLKGLITNIKDIKDEVAANSGNFDGESPFVKVTADKSVKIRFLQELDEDSELYDERRGRVAVVAEHSSPKDFKKTAICTAKTEGRCWACEQRNTANSEIAKKWKAKMKFYAQVIVRGVDGEPDKVKILKQGFGNKAIGDTLIQIAEEFEQLGGQDMKLSRTGSGMNDTSYTLIPVAPKPMTDEEKALELIDIEKFVRYLPYDEQAEFFNSDDSAGGKKEDWK